MTEQNLSVNPESQTATPEPEAVNATNGNGQSVGDANGQSAAETDQGFTKVDPKTLPPHLKSVYDNMYRDYQKKTTEIAERVKAETAKNLEQFKAKAEWYDAALKDGELVKVINAHIQARQAVVPEGQQASDPQMQELQTLKQQVQELQKDKVQTEALTTINAFAEAKNEKGELLHPDFDKLSAFRIGTHPQSGEYDLLRAAIELAPGNTHAEKLENGYKAAKATYDAIFEEGKKAGMGRLHEKARNGTLTPSGSVNPSSVATRQPKNALEALQFARQGLMPAQK